MSQHLQSVTAGQPRPEWQEALDDLEQSLHQALRAVALLRHELERRNPLAQAAPPSAYAPAPPSQVAPAPAPPPQQPATRVPASFDRLWDRVEQERLAKQGQGPGASARGPRHGLDALPQSYLMTVEDREGSVDLIPLHRALANLSNVQEVSLASYANGVPVVSLRVEGELDLDELGKAVSTEMDRECEVIPQDTGKIYLRLRAWRE